MPKVRRSEREHRLQVEKIIDFLELAPYRDKLIAGLPYGIRKVVEIARALAANPKLILLDEPASGLSVEETSEMAWWIEDMQKDLGLTILMVEHDMSLVNRVSDRVLAVAGFWRKGQLPRYKPIHKLSRPIWVRRVFDVND